MADNLRMCLQKSALYKEIKWQVELPENPSNWQKARCFSWSKWLGGAMLFGIDFWKKFCWLFDVFVTDWPPSLDMVTEGNKTAALQAGSS